MKTIDLDKVQPDPMAAARVSADKETVTVSGCICSVDKNTISLSETRDGTCIELARSTAHWRLDEDVVLDSRRV